MSRSIRLRFPNKDIHFIADLLDDEAPKTCNAIWNSLPVKGVVRHAIYSGRELYMILPSHLHVDYENATSWVLPGDLGYGFIEGGRWMEYKNDLAEIAIFYGRGTRPCRAPGEFMELNIFAKIPDNLEQLEELGEEIRNTGSDKMVIEKVE